MVGHGVSDGDGDGVGKGDSKSDRACNFGEIPVAADNSRMAIKTAVVIAFGLRTLVHMVRFPPP